MEASRELGENVTRVTGYEVHRPADLERTLAPVLFRFEMAC